MEIPEEQKRFQGALAWWVTEGVSIDSLPAFEKSSLVVMVRPLTSEGICNATWPKICVLYKGEQGEKVGILVVELQWPIPAWLGLI